MQSLNLAPKFTAWRARVNWRVAFLAVLTGLLIIGLNLYAPAGPSPLQRFMASLLIALCSLPTLLWASDRQWGHSLTPLLGVTYALNFGTPVFLLTNLRGSWFRAEFVIEESIINTALFLALAGWALLLVGYFGLVHRRLAGKLPRCNVLPDDNRKLVIALAVVIGIAAAPFVYLDNAAVVAFYSGDTLLPSGTHFPVELFGQFTILSVLVLFYLHLRGELGLAGKVFMWALVAYYVLLGVSTGLVNQGLYVIFAIFVAWVTTARVPTWRGALYGVLAASVLIFVLLPIRTDLRVLIWTHGVDADISSRISSYEFSPAAVPDGLVVTESDYEVVLTDGVLTYFHKEAARCRAEQDYGATLMHFLHIFPVNADDLPAHRADYNYDNLDFPVSVGGAVVDGRCVHEVRLPTYPIASIRIGLYTLVAPQHQHRAGVLLDEQIFRLATFVPTSYREVDVAGEFQLYTLDANTWEVDPATGNVQRRLVIGVTDESNNAALASVAPGDTIRVEVDRDNWAEYLVGGLVVTDLRVTFRLVKVLYSKGGRSALTPGGSPATLIYRPRSGGPAAGAPVNMRTESFDSVGRNPIAPRNDESQAKKTVTYMQVLWGFVRSGGVSSFDRLRNSLDAAASRLEVLLRISWIIKQIPENVPYLKGETYYPMLFKLIPRLVWEDKPKEIGNLGQRFGFLPEGNEINAIKVHVIGEMYANFGALGVLLGMLALGILFRVVYQLFFHADASVFTMAAGAHILTVPLVNMEALASGSWGFILWYVVLLALLGAAVRVGLWAWRARR